MKKGANEHINRTFYYLQMINFLIGLIILVVGIFFVLRLNIIFAIIITIPSIFITWKVYKNFIKK